MPIKAKVDDKWTQGQSLGEKMETMLARGLQRGARWALEGLLDIIKDILIVVITALLPGPMISAGLATEQLKSNKDAPPWLRNLFTSIGADEPIKRAMTELFITWTSAFAMITGGMGPFRRMAEYRADEGVRSFLPDPSTAAFMKHIGLMSEEGFTDTMRKLGLHDKLIPLYIELAKRLPNTGEIIAGRWRGTISDGEFSAILKRQGYDDSAVRLYLELSNQLPPLSDLIHMLVRDAFNDSAASQYGYDEDFPTEINEFFAKQGYNPDWAKRYWRSHWNLPSPTQGYEMLHRGLISTSDLDTLLRISDYPPFWREKLRDISYNVLTRVDVRRLLQAGLIDEGKALESYQQMGYTPEDAKLLTEFAIAGISQDERDLTKTDVLNLYEEGLIDRGAAGDNLVKMGYDGNEAENILQLSDVAIAKAVRSDLVNFTKEKYLAKKIDENTARSELSQIGLKAQSVDRYILNWQRATEVESAIPSIADVKRWYLSDYIDEGKFRAYLAQHRHTDENIALYVRQLNDQKKEMENEQQA